MQFFSKIDNNQDADKIILNRKKCFFTCSQNHESLTLNAEHSNEMYRTEFTLQWGGREQDTELLEEMQK